MQRGAYACLQLGILLRGTEGRTTREQCVLDITIT
jgi:hypothetical protein